MPLTATLITDERIAPAPWLRDSQGDVIGQRNYRVNTHDEEVALTAVPVRGSIWSPNYPTLQLIWRTTRYMARKDAAAVTPDPPLGGLTIVQCDYAIPRTGNVIPPAPNLKYTELGFGVETATQKFDLRSPAAPPGTYHPINNGAGAAKNIGVVRARVTVYANSANPISLNKIIKLTRLQALNDAPLVLPSIYGTSLTYTMQRGEVQYVGIDPPEVVNGLVKIVHNLNLAQNRTVNGIDYSGFVFSYDKETPEGKSLGEEVIAVQYVNEDMSGLW